MCIIPLFRGLYESFVRANLVFEKLFVNLDDSSDITNAHDFFLKSIQFYRLLLEVISLFDIHVLPADLKNETNEENVIEKIYYLIKERKTIKESRKLNYIRNVVIPNEEEGDPLPKGTRFIASFMSKLDCELFGKEISIFAVGLVMNAIVDKVEYDSDGNRLIYFTDTEDSPMFFSYKGFLNETEAVEEQKKVFENHEEYECAKTVFELIKDGASFMANKRA